MSGDNSHSKIPPCTVPSRLLVFDTACWPTSPRAAARNFVTPSEHPVRNPRLRSPDPLVAHYRGRGYVCF